MIRRNRLSIVLALTLSMFAAPLLAAADVVRDRIVRELQDEGYREIRISRTLLGRMRFVGMKVGARREIVVNPATGVILRDYLELLQDESGVSGSGSSVSGGFGNSGSGSEDDDDDEDDDEDDGEDDDGDDEDDEDNSGSGSSNSGRGSGDDKDDDDDDDDD